MCKNVKNPADDPVYDIDSQIKLIVTRLKVEREKARISQMDLSFMAGLSQNLVNYIESGRRIPNLGTLLKICNALQIEPSTLFSPSDEERRTARETIISLAKKYV